MGVVELNVPEWFDSVWWMWALAWLSVLSVATLAFSLIALPLLIVRLPADYFISQPIRDWPTRHPAVHVALVLFKNFCGLLLLLAGIAMLVLPGQGLLTILMAILLLDFPRKRELERWLIRLPGLRRSANWIRQRHGREPLRLDEPT